MKSVPVLLLLFLWSFLFLENTLAQQRPTNMQDALSMMKEGEGSGERLKQLPADTYLHDLDQQLSPSQRQAFEQQLKDYEAETDARVWLVLTAKVPFMFSSFKLKALVPNWALSKEKPKHWAVLFINTSSSNPQVESLFADYLDVSPSSLDDDVLKIEVEEGNAPATVVEKGMENMKERINDGLYDTDKMPDWSKPTEERCVYDFSRLLRKGEEAEIEQLLQSFEQEMQMNWRTVIVPQRPDTSSLQHFAASLSQQWGLAQPSKPWVMLAIHEKMNQVNISLAAHPDYAAAVGPSVVRHLESAFVGSFGSIGLKTALTELKGILTEGGLATHKHAARDPLPMEGALLNIPLFWIVLNLLLLLLFRKHLVTQWPSLLLFAMVPQVLLYLSAHFFLQSNSVTLTWMAAYCIFGGWAALRIVRKGNVNWAKKSYKGREQQQGWGGPSSKPKNTGNGWGNSSSSEQDSKGGWG